MSVKVEINSCPYLRISKCAYRPENNGPVPEHAKPGYNLNWADVIDVGLRDDVTCVLCLVAQDFAEQAKCYGDLELHLMD